MKALPPITTTLACAGQTSLAMKIILKWSPKTSLPAAHQRRFNQSVTESSWDTDQVLQQDENAPNAIVSYYVSGIIAMCLDLKLRLERGRHNLDTVMHCCGSDMASLKRDTG